MQWIGVCSLALQTCVLCISFCTAADSSIHAQGARKEMLAWGTVWVSYTKLGARAPAWKPCAMDKIQTKFALFSRPYARSEQPGIFNFLKCDHEWLQKSHSITSSKKCICQSLASAVGAAAEARRITMVFQLQIENGKLHARNPLRVWRMPQWLADLRGILRQKGKMCSSAWCSWVANSERALGKLCVGGSWGGLSVSSELPLCQISSPATFDSKVEQPERWPTLTHGEGRIETVFLNKL